MIKIGESCCVLFWGKIMPKYSYILFFVSMMVRGATTQQLIDTSNSLLDLIITQSETVFIPRLFQPDINSLLDGLVEESIIDYLDVADASKYDYLINAGSAVLVDSLTQSELDHPEGKVTEWEAELSAYVMQFVDKFIILRQNGRAQEWSVADFISTFGLPIGYLGNVAALMFQNRKLTSLFGLQNINNDAICALILNKNYLFAPPRDVQFPSDPFGGNFYIVLQITLFDNPTLRTLPANLFQNRMEVKELYMRNIGLHSFSDELFSNLYSLRVLHLRDNYLKEVSHAQIQNLTMLEDLALDGNLLSVLPDNLFDGLSRIEWLCLQDNSLISWPTSVLDGLIDLEELYLGNNALDAFDPNVISDGTHVYLEGNNITQSQLEVLEEKFPDVTFDI